MGESFPALRRGAGPCVPAQPPFGGCRKVPAGDCADTKAMLPGEEFSEDDGGDRVAAWAVMAGLVALYAAALALWAPDGVPWGRSHRHVEPPAAEAGRAAAARVRDPALPVSRLCFRGPRGEPVDAPGAQENCSPGAADAGLRVAGAAQ